ncbi:alpha/beta fold hydrolase [Nocardia arthritidis]|uniref:Alpha/beta fold hydrolase n=1 Tax=Nocardia arthritidis TaxID=228602 RepID=A0A6G9YU18_9NOCA|nr:alpha/beta hydrolase [Nocardia arthritidis]QIS16702.1 alpha/beta fold hydrolase [Nocardia arthritidis]
MLEAINIPTAAGTFDALSSGAPGGREVLLLHGFPESAAAWEFQLTALGGGGCHAVAPNQRGYSPGVRPERVAEYRLEELVGDVAAIADELDWRRFDLVGHDWGAYVAWAFAAEQPERVRSLTAVSVPHPAAFLKAIAEDEDQAQRSAYMQLLRQPRVAERTLLADDCAALRKAFEWKVPQERIEEHVGRLGQQEALTAALNWYRAMHLSGPVGKVEVPTLYVWGTEDSAVGSTAALAAEGYVRGPYRFEMLEDVSHWIPKEAPEALTRLIMEHLLAHRV